MPGIQCNYIYNMHIYTETRIILEPQQSSIYIAIYVVAVVVCMCLVKKCSMYFGGWRTMADAESYNRKQEIHTPTHTGTHTNIYIYNLYY